jgi:hypothetical protein
MNETDSSWGAVIALPPLTLRLSSSLPVLSASNTVKPVLEMLIADGLVEQEKIGTT